MLMKIIDTNVASVSCDSQRNDRVGQKRAATIVTNFACQTHHIGCGTQIVTLAAAHKSSMQSQRQCSRTITTLALCFVSTQLLRHLRRRRHSECDAHHAHAALRPHNSSITAVVTAIRPTQLLRTHTHTRQDAAVALDQVVTHKLCFTPSATTRTKRRVLCCHGRGVNL